MVDEAALQLVTRAAARFGQSSPRGDRRRSNVPTAALTQGERRRSRGLGDCLDSFESTEHVARVAALPQEAPERTPDLGEDAVSEVE